MRTDKLDISLEIRRPEGTSPVLRINTVSTITNTTITDMVMVTTTGTGTDIIMAHLARTTITATVTDITVMDLGMD